MCALGISAITPGCYDNGTSGRSLYGYKVTLRFARSPQWFEFVVIPAKTLQDKRNESNRTDGGFYTLKQRDKKLIKKKLIKKKS